MLLVLAIEVLGESEPLGVAAPLRVAVPVKLLVRVAVMLPLRLGEPLPLAVRVAVELCRHRQRGAQASQTHAVAAVAASAAPPGRSPGSLSTPQLLRRTHLTAGS